MHHDQHTEDNTVNTRHWTLLTLSLSSSLEYNIRNDRISTISSISTGRWLISCKENITILSVHILTIHACFLTWFTLTYTSIHIVHTTKIRSYTLAVKLRLCECYVCDALIILTVMTITVITTIQYDTILWDVVSVLNVSVSRRSLERLVSSRSWEFGKIERLGLEDITSRSRVSWL